MHGVQPTAKKKPSRAAPSTEARGKKWMRRSRCSHDEGHHPAKKKPSTIVTSPKTIFQRSLVGAQGDRRIARKVHRS